jgi:hypothetical protein
VKRLALLCLLVVCISCKPAPKPVKTAAAGPVVRATVVTMRTTIEPDKRTFDTTLIIAGDRVRNTADRDTWRLYDTKARTVTFVDDVDKTIRTEPLATILQRRKTTFASALPAHFPHARITRGSATKTIQGVKTEQSVIDAGTYKRELWLGEHRAIPRDLFAMMHAAEPPSTPLAPMMRDVDAALVAMRGFPLADHSEVEYGKTKLVVDRTVVSIVQKDVPESLVTPPKNYRAVK